MKEDTTREQLLGRRRIRPPVPSEGDTQTHVHEFLGSTKLAEEEEERHNHRFAGVTTEEIPVHCSHVHGFSVNTDFFDHHHEVTGLTGLAIEVEEDKHDHLDVHEHKHVHFAEGTTTEVDGHVHEFQFATLIESPLLPQPHCPERPE